MRRDCIGDDHTAHPRRSGCRIAVSRVLDDEDVGRVEPQSGRSEEEQVRGGFASVDLITRAEVVEVIDEPEPGEVRLDPVDRQLLAIASWRSCDLATVIRSSTPGSTETFSRA